ncbi:hypothetical protein NDU88_002638 [Pleurodeles waltl]|uniref:Gem-associated protein 4 n=1 Tax=Pleurodeles waltl TaxID=8319 RepID=A0AAV7UB33_PLEWA|nr:hypothetical protein NDU88_002638 [Pleurodeles waltl]
MDSGPWDVREEIAVLQGGFLLAEKQYNPKRLIHLDKSDWALIGQPIIHAVEEICTEKGPSQNWKKRFLAIIWAKILDCCSEAALPPESRDVDKKWKEDLFFSVGNMLPSLNHTPLFELLKTMKTYRMYAELLLVLPDDICSKEARSLVEHVLEETSVEDIVLFLDVWWEILKHTEEPDDDMVIAFRTLAQQYAFDSSDGFIQNPKRFKCDPQVLRLAPHSACVLSFFLEGLKQMKTCILPLKQKCYALANLADTLLAPEFHDQQPTLLSMEQYLAKLANLVTAWNSDVQSSYHHSSLSEKLKEAERQVRAVERPTKFTLTPDVKSLGLMVLNDLLICWGSELQCVATGDTSNSYESYRTAESLSSLLEKLNSSEHECEPSGDDTSPGVVKEVKYNIVNLLQKLATGRKVDVDLLSSITMNVITEKMYRHKEACLVFASKSEWALSTEWVNCLEENRALFCEPDLLIALLETVMASVGSGQEQIQRTSMAMGAILTCFSELSLTHKNKVLSAVLSTWGEKGLSQKLNTFMAGFQEELNMAFNQITQSSTDSGLAKAVSAVARLALLHPETTVRKACYTAVGNLGAHTFLSQIIGSLPALSFRDPQNSNASLLVNCLRDTSWGNFSSDKEERQFLAFLTSLMKPSQTTVESSSVVLLGPGEVITTLVLPYLTSDFTNVTLCLQILNTALSVELPADNKGRHWVMSCSPFPLLLSLCRLLNEFTKYWQNTDTPQCLSIECKDLIIDALEKLCDLVQLEATAFSETWNKSLFWLHRKMEHLDWTVGLRLKPLFGDHFKNEVPASLFEVCTLCENDWTPLHLPEYGPGTGLLAWMECCSISATMKDQMLSLLAVNTKNPEDVNYFSKGFLVALIQVFPWCNSREWDLLSQVVKSLLQRQLLHVPYTLEYVQFMPLLNLRPFAHDLQFSVLLLRGFQLLCSTSCSDWLPVEGWKHAARLYCSNIASMLESVKAVLSMHDQKEGVKDQDLLQEALFVYTQAFCHVLHIVAMMPPDTCEPLYFLSLEILCLYEATGASDTSTNSLLRRANERHFLHSITENVTNKEQRITLLQKISKLK